MTDNNREIRAQAFFDAHSIEDPLLLFNCWDVITAQKSAEHCAAVATSSGAVAMAQGFDDGEKFPLEDVVTLCARIVNAVDKPLTVDFEAAYSDDPDAAAENVLRLAESGVVGINLEDSLSSAGRDLMDVAAQARKMEAIKTRLEQNNLKLFLNARTDAFIMKAGTPDECVDMSIQRAAVYKQAGADGVFVPFVSEPDLIKQLADQIELPLNVLVKPEKAELEKLSGCGVSRYSMGAWPMSAALGAFTELLKSAV